MTDAEYKKAESFLILKYGSIPDAIDRWLEMSHDVDSSEEYDMLELFLWQTAKRES